MQLELLSCVSSTVHWTWLSWLETRCCRGRVTVAVGVWGLINWRRALCLCSSACRVLCQELDLLIRLLDITDMSHGTPYNILLVTQKHECCREWGSKARREERKEEEGGQRIRSHADRQKKKDGKASGLRAKRKKCMWETERGMTTDERAKREREYKKELYGERSRRPKKGDSHNTHRGYYYFGGEKRKEEGNLRRRERKRSGNQKEKGSSRQAEHGSKVGGRHSEEQRSKQARIPNRKSVRVCGWECLSLCAAANLSALPAGVCVQIIQSAAHWLASPLCLHS